MTLASSWTVFQQVLESDRQFHRLGLPRGWYLRFHYWGRWCDRRQQVPPIETLRATVLGQPVTFPLSFAYAGMAKGILLDQEYHLAPHLGFTPRTIVDLGANIGLGALYLHCQFPQAHLACVEPDPRNLPLLRQTLDLNGIPARVIEGAVGSTGGSLNLRFGKNPACSALETSPMHQLEQQVVVTVQTLPQLLSDLGWEDLDLLKIDIEGTEDELLSQDNQWLDRVRAIVLEIHPNTTPAAIGRYLQPYGFHLTRHSHGREPVYLALRSPA
jgi:FkbM family methyltransferase